LAGTTYAWETADDVDIPEEEPVFEEVPETEAPLEPMTAPPAEVPVGESVQEPVDEVTEEADAQPVGEWAMSTSLPEVNQFVDHYLAESQSFRRVFNDRVGKEVLKATGKVRQEFQGKLEESERNRIKAEAAMHKLFWQGKSEAEIGALVQNPEMARAFQDWKDSPNKLKEVESRPQIPEYIRNVQEEVEDFVGSASVYLSEQDFAAIQNYARSEKFWTAFSNNPTKAIPHLKETIDRRILALQNTGVRTADTARANEPAQVAAQAPRQAPAVVRGNSKASQFAPDSTVRSGSGGGSVRPVTEAQLEAMDPDQYDAFLTSISAKNSTAAKKMGYVKG